MSQSSSTTSWSTAEPSAAQRNLDPAGVMTAISPSLGNWTARVSVRKAAAFEARNASPSARPTTMGHCSRAPTSMSGWSRWMTTNAKWPSSSP